MNFWIPDAIKDNGELVAYTFVCVEPVAEHKRAPARSIRVDERPGELDGCLGGRWIVAENCCRRLRQIGSDSDKVVRCVSEVVIVDTIACNDTVFALLVRAKVCCVIQALVDVPWQRGNVAPISPTALQRAKKIIAHCCSLHLETSHGEATIIRRVLPLNLHAQPCRSPQLRHLWRVRSPRTAQRKLWRWERLACGAQRSSCEDLQAAHFTMF
jgi:hypothetical protein